MLNPSYFLIDIINLSCIDTIRFLPIKTSILDIEVKTKNNSEIDAVMSLFEN